MSAATWVLCGLSLSVVVGVVYAIIQLGAILGNNDSAAGGE